MERLRGNMPQYPIFINCRDRLTCTSMLLDRLVSVGCENILLVDNGSTYEPLLDWYKSVNVEVIYLNDNFGQQAPWRAGLVEKYASNNYFVVTDPDILPIDECPDDFMDYFKSVLDRYSDRTKVGFNLKIDDIPDHYRFKKEVIAHESQYQNWLGPEDLLLFAPIDTTFALYRPNASIDISFSCRTKYPYIARHYPWYLDSNNPGDEEIYYINNANPVINSWSHMRKPFWM